MNCTSANLVTSDHVVQFFDTDESRAERVADFLAEGYRQGEPLVVVARPVVWPAVIERLQHLGVNPNQAAAEGMLVVKNAEDTLRRISRGGLPDPELFQESVGRAMSVLATRGPRVRAYGEMVDILAQREELDAALALETLWNVTAEKVPIYLLCGYSAAHFVPAGTHSRLREICAAHSGVEQDAHDPLASWVLTTAHNCGTDPSAMRH
jgi:hypothetical protein